MIYKLPYFFGLQREIETEEKDRRKTKELASYEEGFHFVRLEKRE